MTKSKKKKLNYTELRKQHLLEDNEKEDRIIKQLSKKLKMNRNNVKGKRKKEQTPLWLTQCGFDYLLNFEKCLDIQNNDGINNNNSDTLCTTVGVSAKKKSKTLDLYGQNTSISKSLPGSTAVDDDGVDDKFTDDSSANEQMKICTDLPAKVEKQEEEIVMSTPHDNDDSNALVYKFIRSSLNRLSESQMPKIITELCDLFTTYPRASVRSCLIEEVCNLIECTQVNRNSKMGWLHQELAVCLACVQITLHSLFQSGPVIGYLVESIIFRLFPKNSEVQLSSNVICAYSVFLAYLYRFGIISGTLILDILKAYLHDYDLGKLKAAHFISIAVGVNLRKFNLNVCQEIIQQASNELEKHQLQNSEMSFELEGFIQRLSEKRSLEECVARSLHLSKLMKVWTKGIPISGDMCLSIGLDDLLNATSTGRWWLIGSAVNRTVKSKDEKSKVSVINPEIVAVAETLGLRTTTRQMTFSILVSTPGGPDATASALLKACHTSANSPGVQLGAGGLAAREREMIHIILHCVMSEMPFNRFYPRVLGGILNCHRRFLMMIKCGFWDILNNANLTVEAKSNAGRALGLLCLVYNFPLTVLKNYNFADNSHGNIAFLQYTLIELCTGEYQNVLSKLMQLSIYTRLCRNCRIFMHKHLLNTTSMINDTFDTNHKAIIVKLISDMRDVDTI
ncbi:Nucleolar MIF4G domain-containing protein 1 [Schistosoma japonicum]|nr:Nucleolar MIF4G domain-containing protein 1 [Schistosoma japonicum]